MTFDVTAIVSAFIALLAAIASTVLLPWLRAKLGAETLAEALKWVSIAVRAAEQLYDVADGETKKLYVVNYLKDRGVTLDEEALDLAIEAAVNALHTELYGAVSADAE